MNSFMCIGYLPAALNFCPVFVRDSFFLPWALPLYLPNPRSIKGSQCDVKLTPPSSCGAVNIPCAVGRKSVYRGLGKKTLFLSFFSFFF